MSTKQKSKFRKLLQLLNKKLEKIRVRAARMILPRTVYIQNSPDIVIHLKKFEEFFSDSKRYVRDQKDQWDVSRWVELRLLLEWVKTLPEGDYAELGTHKGITARLIFNQLAEGTKFYCFDTFEGFVSSDLETEKNVSGVISKSGHFSDTSVPDVQKQITGKEEGDPRLSLIKGFFPDSFKGFEDMKFRFVQLDADLYAPMKSGLEKFWPRIVPGGVLVLHDYNGTYTGTKIASDEFFGPLGIIPVPVPDKVGSAVVIKPLNHK